MGAWSEHRVIRRVGGNLSQQRNNLKNKGFEYVVELEFEAMKSSEWLEQVAVKGVERF